ncbi:hypothetical protein [Hyphomicrobium sp.]|uniref:hypothetical protein n=1 Tax=Hyphomicrobium sp. TaxID=82 RepID=UPI001DABEB29|nr:hypothetical protein [Hyphomicrobium sp.]MBY0561563.1 hypothetical protein [Hyphomicrobium sp.]
MTVCIALVAGGGRHGKIVTCYDTLASSSLGTKSIMLKDRAVGFDWRCLTAGNEEEINAFVPLLSASMMQAKELDEVTAVPLIQDVLKKRKTQLADELTLSKWGLSFQEFRQSRAQFPDQIYQQHFDEVQRLPLRAEFIVTGFQKTKGVSYGPMMIVVRSDWSVSIQEDFCAIGEGSYLATASLMRRHYSDVKAINFGIYCAYEAKKYAESVPSVGTTTGLAIYSSDGPDKTINSGGFAELDKLFSAYGPRDVEADLNLKAKMNVWSGDKFKIEGEN